MNHLSQRKGIDWNEGHPDHEGDMAVTQLHRLAEMSTQLLEILGEDDDIPGWIQYKISRSFDDLNSVFGYLEPKSRMLHLPEMNPVMSVHESRKLRARLSTMLREIKDENR